MAVLKPGAYASARLTGSTIGTTGNKFYMKLVRARLRHRTKVIEYAGDGDQYVTADHNNLLYGTLLLEGWVIAAAKIGLAEMFNDTNNPISTLTVHLDAVNEIIYASACVEAINVDFDLEGPFVPVSMLLRVAGQVSEDASA